MSRATEERRLTLARDRETIQKRTFTRWCNSFLRTRDLEITDLYTDLADGVLLINLLECLSQMALPTPGRGRLRVHKLENVGKALSFLRANKVKLESISAENVVDGDPRLILGLIWTIILRFQIQDIKLEGDAKSAKDALLYWCQKVTKGYSDVDVRNFTSSWKDGLAFNAIIHSFRPDLVDYKGLPGLKPKAVLENAFTTADSKLGIASLLEPEDVMICADEKSVITYLVAYYHYFSKLKSEEVDIKRLTKHINFLLEVETMQNQYVALAEDLIAWIRRKTRELEDRRFPNSLQGMQNLLQDFKNYRMVEKPPRFVDRGDLEAHLFSVQTALFSMNQAMWTPPDGLLISDLNDAWQVLERAEHGREIDSRKELIRQERLHQLAMKFNRKAELRESWLEDNERIIQIPDFGDTVKAVEALLKRHEAIETDVRAHKARIDAVISLSEELQLERYRLADDVADRESAIVGQWKRLLALLQDRRLKLDEAYALQKVLREMHEVGEAQRELLRLIDSTEVGKHLRACEDMLQHHKLHEADMAVAEGRVRAASQAARPFLEARSPGADKLLEARAGLESQQDGLEARARARKVQLDAAVTLQLFYRDADEVDLWLRDKETLLLSQDVGRDLTSVTSLQRKHQSLLQEMASQEKGVVRAVLDSGRRLVVQRHFAAASVEARCGAMQAAVQRLQSLARTRRALLDVSQLRFHFEADSNEAESWIRERRLPASSDDYGRDEAGTEAQLKKHAVLEAELAAYKATVGGLRAQAGDVARAIRGSGDPGMRPAAAQPPSLTTAAAEPAMAPRYIRALYPYEGRRKQELSMAKGEYFFLKEETNADWWKVMNARGASGFVPSNYIKEAKSKKAKAALAQVEPPALFPTSGSEPSTPSTPMTPDSKGGGGSAYVFPEGTAVGSSASPPRGALPGAEAIQERMDGVAALYGEVLAEAAARRQALEEALMLHTLHREADEMESWVADRKLFAESGEVGNDLEQVTTLDAKFQDFEKDIAANAARLARVNALADRLLAETRSSQGPAIRARKESLNAAWRALLAAAEGRARDLRDAKEVFTLLRGVQETRAWISEKAATVGDDLGRDLAGVEALQRRHQVLENDLVALRAQVGALGSEAAQLADRHPPKRPAIEAAGGALRGAWDALEADVGRRKALLSDAKALHAFRADARDMSSWVDGMAVQIGSGEAASSLPHAEALAQRHAEYRAEIEARAPSGDRLLAMAADLGAGGHYAAAELEATAGELQRARGALDAAWQARDVDLRQSHERLEFGRDAEHARGALARLSSALATHDLGDSPGAVDALLREHGEVQGSLAATDEALQRLQAAADRLGAAGHPGAAAMRAELADILSARRGLGEAHRDRRARLEEAQQLHAFLRDADEFEGYMAERLQTATDGCYTDLANLQSKSEGHQAFAAELEANRPSLEALEALAARLAAANHYASGEVRERLGAVQSRWAHLVAETARRGERLEEAKQQQDFNRLVEDKTLWCQEVATALASEDLGRDLVGARHLLKKHELLASECAAERPQVARVGELAAALVAKGHFDGAGITARAGELAERYAALGAAVERRRAGLEGAVELQALYSDLAWETSWVKEKASLAASTDLGKGLSGAQSLLGSHAVLEGEVSGHGPALDALDARAAALCLATGGGGGPDPASGAEGIAARRAALADQRAALGRDLASRRALLEDAERLHAFMVACADADDLVEDKMPLVLSPDYGRDTTATEALAKQHQSVMSDLSGHAMGVQRLAASAKALVAAGHYDHEAVRARMAEVERRQAEVERLAAVRRDRLAEALKLHAFHRNADETEGWVTEHLVTAASREIGKDQEDCEVLAKRFDAFEKKVAAGVPEHISTVERQARDLLALGHAESEAVLVRLTELQAMWEELQALMAARGEMLDNAQEIHAFNQAADEVMTRMHEKLALVSYDDYGKDLTAVDALQRKHGVFERELDAMALQVQGTVRTAERLEVEFPDNLEAILLKKEEVSATWDLLTEQAAEVKARLADSRDLHGFVTGVKHLLDWHGAQQQAFEADPLDADVEQSRLAVERHLGFKADIEARGQSMQALVATGRHLVAAGHYEADVIDAQLDVLESGKNALMAAWERRRLELEQNVKLQRYLRDARLAEANLAKVAGRLASDPAASSVEGVEALLKRHDDVVQSMALQDEKIAQLDENARELVGEGHFDAGNISALRDRLAGRHQQNKDVAAAKAKTLQDTLAVRQLLREIDEMDSWISQKMQVAGDESYKDPTNLAGKLTKHRAFEAELAAHGSQFAALQEECRVLLGSDNAERELVRSKAKGLALQWDALGAASAARLKKLHESAALVDFQRLCDEVEAWLGDRLALASSTAVGADLEETLILAKRFEEAEKDVDQGRVNNVNAAATALTEAAHYARSEVRQRQRDVNARWAQLRDASAQRRKALAAAEAVNGFLRRAAEAREQVLERQAKVASDDCGRDLASVEALQRLHETSTRDFPVLDEQVAQLSKAARALARTHRGSAEAVRGVQQEASRLWEETRALAQRRTARLSDARDLHGLMAKHRDLLSWARDMSALVSGDALADSVNAAEVLVKRHQENKGEIDAREPDFAALQQAGQRMATARHYAAADIRETLAQTAAERVALHALWEERRVEYAQCHELRLFERDADKLDAWLGQRRAALEQGGLGDSLASVETLRKKHANVLKSINVQDEKLRGLEDTARRLGAPGRHYAAAEIAARLAAVGAARAALADAVRERERRLEDARRLQQLRRDARELASWTREKLQAAQEASYLEPTNLQRKLQRHLAFEAEVSANKDRVEALRAAGGALLAQPGGHFAAEEIGALVAAAEAGWADLDGATGAKGQRLREAIQEQQFSQRAADLEAWIGETEAALGSAELGRDITQVQALLKRHALVEADVAAHKPRVDDLTAQAEAFHASHNFLAAPMTGRAVATAERFVALGPPAVERRVRLEASLELRRFLRDASDEASWIREKMPLAASPDVGKDLTAVQSLLKKHRAFEAERASHERRVGALGDAAARLAERSHYALAEVRAAHRDVADQWEDLREASAARLARLAASLAAHEYLSHATEAESWMAERAPLVASTEYGRDEDASQALLKKHAAVLADLEAYHATVADLAAECAAVADVAKGADAGGAARGRQAGIVAEYERLLARAGARRTELLESLALHRFEREAAEAEGWLADREAVAAVADLGRDKEEAELLIKKHDDFEKELLARRGDVAQAVDALAREQVEAGHSQADVFVGRQRDVAGRLGALVGRAQQRRHELASAHEIHAFDREVDETIAWMDEKDGLLHDDYGADFAGVEALQRRHEVFERDLAAIEDKVAAIRTRASFLCGTQPGKRPAVDEREQEVASTWAALKEKSEQRRRRLEESYELQQYLNSYRDLDSWMDDAIKAIETEGLASDVAGCEAHRVHHLETKAEVDARKDSFRAFFEAGRGICHRNTFAMQGVQDAMKALAEKRNHLLEVWEKKQEAIEQHHDMLEFLRDTAHVNSWISLREGLASSEQLGDSLDEVEALLKKHDDFEKSLAVQEDKLQSLNRRTKAETKNRGTDKATKFRRRSSLSAVALFSDMEQQELLEANQTVANEDDRRIRELNAARRSLRRKKRTTDTPIPESADSPIASPDREQAGADKALRARELIAAKAEKEGSERPRVAREAETEARQVAAADEAECLKAAAAEQDRARRRAAEADAEAEASKAAEKEAQRLKAAAAKEEAERRKAAEGEAASAAAAAAKEETERQAAAEREAAARQAAAEREETEARRAAESAAAEAAAAKQARAAEEAAHQAVEAAREPTAAVDLPSPIPHSNGNGAVADPADLSRVKRLLETNGRTSSVSSSEAEEDAPGDGKAAAAHRGGRRLPTLPRGRKPSAPRSDLALDPAVPASKEGPLIRKTEKDAGGKKSSSRSWKNVHVSLRGPALYVSAGRDQPPHAKTIMTGSLCDVASDYKKRANVFRVSADDGSETMFQASGPAAMQAWLAAIRTAGSPT